MKRYKPAHFIKKMGSIKNGDEIGVRMDEDSAGGWVRWKDVKAETLRIEEIYRRIRHKEIIATPESVMECNCHDMSLDPDQYFWICPAHGYKRR